MTNLSPTHTEAPLDERESDHPNGDPGRHMSTHAPRDEGSALVLALIFVLGISLVITALLTQTSTSFRTTQVVRTNADKVYAADAGLEQAIETLRLDPTVCATPGDNDPMPSITSNGHTVALACSNEGDGSSVAERWAVIVTGTASDSFTTLGGGTKEIDGPVFAANLGNPNVDVTNGSVFEKQSATSCATDADQPPKVSIAPSPPFRYRCTTSGVPDRLHDLPAGKPTPTDPLPSTVDDGSGPCQVFSPGTYTSLSLANDNYFRSGTYYFENVVLSIDQTVIGGKPDPAENAVVDSPACAGAQAADPGLGSGIKWILGGTSLIDVGIDGHLELFARQGGAPSEAQMGISLQAATTVAGEFIGSAIPLSTPLMSVSGGNSELVVHGMVYAPTSYLDTFGAPQASFQGGIVVQKLHLIAGGLFVAVSDALGTRSIVVTATADGTDGVDVTATAVVELDNDEARTLRVVSWRVE